MMMNRLLRSLLLHRYLILAMSLYTVILVSFALGLGGDIKTLMGFLPYLGWGLATSALYFMAMMAFYFARAVKNTKPGKRWFLNVMENFEHSTVGYLRSDRCMDGVVGLLIMFPVSFFFCIAKGLIPTLHKYTIDPALAAADKWLHFGHYPHEYLVPWVARHEQMPAAIDAFYVTWFLVVFLVLDFAIFLDSNQFRRMRFLWTYNISWIVLGNFLALFMASVGPLFFAEFYQVPDPYADLIKHLHEQDKIEHLAIFDAGNLEIGFTKGGAVINLNALSAMPSLHIAIAALLVFYTAKFSRIVASVFLVYCVLIMISSVYLGWHYAIDGYVGIVGTWLIWWLSGPLVKKLHPELTAPAA